MAKFKSTSYDKWAAKDETSQFWLGDASKERVSTSDPVQLAAYQRAISNFVKIITKRSDIKVQYQVSGNSYTDGKSVVIGSNLQNKEFDLTVGLALHEGSHIAYTDFSILTTQLPDKIRDLRNSDSIYRSVFLYQHQLQDTLKTLLNIVEDRRIDYIVYSQAPGYRGYYRSMYAKYFNDSIINKALRSKQATKVTLENYLFHICNFTNPNRNLKALPGLLDIWSILDLANISRLKNTQDAFDVSCKMLEIIVTQLHENAQEKEEKSQVEEPENSSPSEGGSSGSSTSTDKDENTEEPQGSGNESTDEEDESESESEEESTDEEDESESESEEESTSTSESLNEGESEEESTSSSAVETQTEEELTDAEESKLQEAIQKQKDFLSGAVNKKGISSKLAQAIQAANELDVEIVETGPERNKFKTYVLHGMSESVVKSNSNLIGAFIQTGWRGENSCEAVTKGLQLGTLLGKKLKTRDEERSLKTTRTSTGRLDKRLVSELGFGNERIFSQIIHATVTPVYVHLSLDASGSMTGSKWDSALKTVVAIAKAASMTSSMHCVISLRGSGTVSSRTNPVVWVVYDSKVDSINHLAKYFPYLYPGSITPEGLCFEALQKEVQAAAKGKEAFFINFSDGEPWFNSYQGSVAHNHTRNEVQKMRNAGIKISSYFIDTHSIQPSREFQYMYSKDSVGIDVNSLNQLARTLNALFERPV